MSSSLEIPPAPVNPEWKKRRRTVKATLVSLGLVAIVVAAVTGATTWSTPLLTDKRDAYGPDLTDVMGRIAAENDRIQKEHPQDIVTLVALMPMTGEPSQIALSRTAIRRGLQGIHLAQRWRNVGADHAPYIRVLVGSNGPDDWEKTVEAVKAQAADQRIVAVTGLGASTATTESTIERLSAASFAMTAAVITSDDFKKYKGLARVAAANSDQARAGMELARHTNAPLKAVVVRDSNQSDSYVATLGQYFTDALADSERLDALSFDSATKSSGIVLDNIAERICNTAANTVLYAGRSTHLPSLMMGLSKRGECVTRGIAVVTGDDASELSRPTNQHMWGSQSIRLFYSALAHPESVAVEVETRFSGEDPKAYKRIFREESLEDGFALMHHDAAYVAIGAVDKFAGDPEPPDPADVASMLTSGTVAVDGAGGKITIGSGGDPLSRKIPILQLGPDGSATFSRWAEITAGSAPK